MKDRKKQRANRKLKHKEEMIDMVGRPSGENQQESVLHPRVSILREGV